MSGSNEATPSGYKAYEVGLDQVDSFTGDPKLLAKAIRTFQSGKSLPYLYAGAAYTLIAASKEKDGTYAQEGLGLATQWLQKAQELVLDRVEINVIEAFIYIYGKEFDNAALVLDYLLGKDPESWYVQLATIAYYREQGMVDDTIAIYQDTIGKADTPPRKLGLQKQLADFYFDIEHFNEALDLYQMLVKFNKKDPELWRRISIIYFRQENWEEADRYNNQVLKLAKIPEAVEMRDMLKQRLNKGGVMGRLFGR
ncbi:MAG TPA: hypothetical protein VLL52_18140 [Anaerolineae bacterium]|nr:hypothetical protein [Anaerolineae bacterium]